MEIGLIISLIFVIICPFAYAFTNIFDKYIVSYRVKKPLGMSAISFIPLFFMGLVMILFSNWSNISLNAMIIPLLGGIFVGAQYYSYFFLIKHEDASNLSGIVYFYPVIVAILSFFILGERLALIGYLGLALIIFGVVKLSYKTSASKSFTGFLIIAVNILLIALYEFSAKLTTSELPLLNGLGLITLISSLVIFAGLAFKKVRVDFISELKNVKWGIASELFTLIATFTLFLALTNLSATVVSAIASIQPMIVLFYEKIAERKLKKISHHDGIRTKIFYILSIILGVAVLYIQEIFK
ncbi:EamA-like transporter family protein [uncultured archaeon]|nr:EamA-like transporter family protein [uncultured archaeon]